MSGRRVRRGRGRDRGRAREEGQADFGGRLFEAAEDERPHGVQQAQVRQFRKAFQQFIGMRAGDIGIGFLRQEARDRSHGGGRRGGGGGGFLLPPIVDEVDLEARVEWPPSRPPGRGSWGIRVGSGGFAP